MEIRVYYESLEQSLHYLVSDLKNELGSDHVILIKKTQQSFNNSGFKKKYSKNLSQILIRKNPDLLITVIENNIEYPLCVIEFSTAVFTKDHEQQRSDNFQLTIKNKLFYIKVSTTKKDSGNHGGDTTYNYLEPYSLCWANYRKIAFHIEWEIDEKNRKFVKKNDLFKSIPHKNDHFIFLIKSILESFKVNGIDSYEKTLIDNIQQRPYFKNWIDKVKSYNSFENIRSINSTRFEWVDYHSDLNKSNVFILKFNRMGHAMDPERGMLTHYNTFFGSGDTYFVSKLVFDKRIESWFKSTPRETKIRIDLSRITVITKSKLIEYLTLGLSFPNPNQLISICGDFTNKIYNISSYVIGNYPLFNASVRTIFDNSNALFLSDGNDQEIYLIWDKFGIDFDYSNLPDITQIQRRTLISEDDITYITMNEIFRINEISPATVSYPGAQSDTPILPDKKNGRKQLRTYIDSVGLKNRSLILQENKGIFKLKDIKDDIEKIAKFRTDQNYIDAIYQFSIELNLEIHEIVIGVGFGYSRKMMSDLPKCGIEKIDYFVVISETLDHWKIYSNIDNDSIFRIKNSSFNYPTTFEVL